MTNWNEIINEINITLHNDLELENNNTQNIIEIGKRISVINDLFECEKNLDVELFNHFVTRNKQVGINNTEKNISNEYDHFLNEILSEVNEKYDSNKEQNRILLKNIDVLKVYLSKTNLKSHKQIQFSENLINEFQRYNSLRSQFFGYQNTEKND